MCNHIGLVLRKQGLSCMAARRNSLGVKEKRYRASDMLGLYAHHVNIEHIIINISATKLTKDERCGHLTQPNWTRHRKVSPVGGNITK